MTNQTTAITADTITPIQVRALRRFIGARLADDLNTDEAAGHGQMSVPFGRDPRRQPEWTRLDEKDNVRLSYDVLFLDRWSPERVRVEITTKLTLARTGDAATLLTLVQDWAEHPDFNPAWVQDRPTERVVRDQIDALAQPFPSFVHDLAKGLDLTNPEGRADFRLRVAGMFKQPLAMDALRAFAEKCGVERIPRSRTEIMRAIADTYIEDATA